MNDLKTVFLFTLLWVWLSSSAFAEPIIIDHRCTDITRIPESSIQQAKATLHIAYGHTSHGSQLISGMGDSGTELDAFMTNNGASPGLYLWNNGPQTGALDLDDYFVDGDLGNPDRITWAQRTRDYLDDPSNSDVNVVMWSWCGQVDGTEQDINTYLTLMSSLEADYPDVFFIYMTGHLNGTGVTGNVTMRNNQIRGFCAANDKILFDFADIESYDPSASVNFMELFANDNCDYDSDGNGSLDSNWALDWQAAHTEGVHWWPSGAAHSQHLNGNRKGYAAWWLWARLAGWNPSSPAPVIEKIRGNKIPGGVIRVIGTGFGATQGNSVLHIGALTLDASSPIIKLWSDTLIRIRLPFKTKPCSWFRHGDETFRRVNAWVTVGGTGSNTTKFRIAKPETCP